MNTTSWIILAVVALCVALAARFVIKARKRGGCSGCGGDCPHCAGCSDQ